MFIIGIEGLVRAGKSTLSSYLGKTLQAKIIPEYGVYTKGSAAFPQYPPATLEEALAAIKFFIGIEQLRVNDLPIGHEIVIVDRTYLTCLAFDYAANHFTEFDIYKESHRLWREATKIEPDLLIFLDVSDEELNRRIAPDKHVYLPHFYQPEFNYHIREFFTNLIDNNHRVVKIDANQNPTAIEQEVLLLTQRFREM